ncbi:MAG: right-handed parallel beta-helix repeat-containing protein [Thermoplasmata archaeon]
MRTWITPANTAFLGYCLAAVISALALVPAITSGYSGLVPSGPVSVMGDDDWPGVSAVSGGSGTSSDPYVIEGLEISPSSRVIGISIHNTKAHLVIRSCHLSNCSNGVVLYNVSNAIIENCEISDCGIGVTVSFSNDCSVIANYISRCEIGVGVYYSDDIRVKSNAYSENLKDFDTRKEFVPWETTWIGTAVCIAVIVPVTIVSVIALRYRIAAKKGRTPPEVQPPSTH